MSLSSPRRADCALDLLVGRARANDDAAWAELIGRFEGTLRAVARSYRLSPADVDDVVQTVWLRLHVRLDCLRDPQAIAGWLVTTTRRASLDVLQRHVHEHLTDDPQLLERSGCDHADEELLAAERSDVLRRAIDTLPAHERRLMGVLATATDYRSVSATLDMPIGSIGPTRARSLDRLRRNPELRGLQLVSG